MKKAWKKEAGTGAAICRRISILLLSGLVLLLSGCGLFTANLEAEDWLSLSYASLEAMDNYEFSGSTVIELSGATVSKPITFQGKVNDHRKLSVQSTSEQSQYTHPSQILRLLKQYNGNGAEVSEQETDSETGASLIKVTMRENKEDAQLRWSEQLRNQLNESITDEPEQGTAQAAAWTNELEKSKRELEEMLKTLQVDSVIDVWIDVRSILPVKLHENTQFTYLRDGEQVDESRKTVVRIHSFDGRSGETVQQR